MLLLSRVSPPRPALLTTQLSPKLHSFVSYLNLQSPINRGASFFGHCWAQVGGPTFWFNLHPQYFKEKGGNIKIKPKVTQQLLALEYPVCYRVSQKNEFYRIEHFQICQEYHKYFFPKIPSRISKCSIWQNSVFFRHPVVGLSILI